MQKVLDIREKVKDASKQLQVSVISVHSYKLYYEDEIYNKI